MINIKFTIRLCASKHDLNRCSHISQIFRAFFVFTCLCKLCFWFWLSHILLYVFVSAIILLNIKYMFLIGFNMCNVHDRKIYKLFFFEFIANIAYFFRFHFANFFFFFLFHTIFI